MSQQESGGVLPLTPTFPDEHHHQPPSTATPLYRDNLPSFNMLQLPILSNTPSPPPRPPTSSASNPPETTTPASTIASILHRAVSDINSNPFKDALAAITAGNLPNSIRRTFSDPTCSAFQEPPATVNTPPRGPRRPLSSPKARRRLDAESPVRESPQSKRLKRVKEIAKEIERRCGEIMLHSEDDQEQATDNNPSQEEEEEEEECVGLDRLKDGLKIQLSCSCGKGFEILFKDNGCFYRLT